MSFTQVADAGRVDRFTRSVRDALKFLVRLSEQLASLDRSPPLRRDSGVH